MKQKVALSAEVLTRQRIGIVGIHRTGRSVVIVLGAESSTPRLAKTCTDRGLAYSGAGIRGNTRRRFPALNGSLTAERAKARRRSLTRAAPRWLGALGGLGIKTTCTVKRSWVFAGLSFKTVSLALIAETLTRREIGTARNG